MKFLNIRGKMIVLLFFVAMMIGTLGTLSVQRLNVQKEESLRQFEKTIREDFDTSLKDQTSTAITILQTVYQGVEAGEYTLSEAKVLGAKLLRNIRFGDDGYFWADTYAGDNIVLLGKADVEGKNRLNSKDSNGFPLVQKIIENGRKSGGGYTDYTFPRPGKEEPMPKRAFSQAFEPFGWVIGTGNYTDFVDNYIAERRTEMNANASASIAIMTTLIVISLIIMIAIGLYITISIVYPLRRFVKVVDSLAKGDFDAELSVKTNDEVGKLAQSLQLLVAKLKTYGAYIAEITSVLNTIGQGDLRLQLIQAYDGEFRPIKDALQNTSKMLNQTLSDVQNASEQVAIGSNQVSSGAQALANGSTEQATSIDELNASLEQVSKQAQGSLEIVNTSAGYIEQAETGINTGNKHMEQLTKAMTEIGDASIQIVGITKTIEDIAFQTNILALNAAIEAARAGNAGKGFAVVADEVRNLAAKSSEAAKQTATLIQASVASVEKGTEITAQTAQILQSVAVITGNVVESFQQIEHSSAKQAGEIEQIKQGLSQISSIVQTNAATAEENSATSEEMSAQATMLREEVRKFKLA